MTSREGGDLIDGGDSVGEVGELDSRGDLAWEAVHLRNDVPDDGKHGGATVLDLADAVLLELRLVDSVGQPGRILKERKERQI